MAKDLVTLSTNQESPYLAEAKDFKTVKSPTAGAAHPAHPGDEGLTHQSETQEGPRHNEDDGDRTPSVWGKGGKAFSVGQSDGGSTTVKIPQSVDLKTGQVVPNVAKGY